MASSSKRQTTMAKIQREQAVRERRVRKQEKKESRKQALADAAAQPAESPDGETTEPEADAGPESPAA